MKRPRAVIFDLDNTLARSFEAPALEMSQGLENILRRIPVAVMSAASFERIEKHLLPGFSVSADKNRLYLFPVNGAGCYTWENGAWRPQYHFEFTSEERARILAALKGSVEETGVGAESPKYGKQVVDYDGYIAFTALGLDAPREEKIAWDPDGSKRRTLRESLQKKIPDFDVYIGGTTSIDIMCKGVNKSYGVMWLAKHLGVEPSDMLFVGDALYPGGNDVVVIPTGVQTIQVAGPHETETVIEEILKACSG
ncbi:hypothetical protein A3F27_02775 [Candidatus Kaiserbacteria bacterium RIFCSPHIGHO2_12_FULL_53_13]|uniref:phosphomannomutase n=1 Tax=Candidatus Kaiserbacteria bacterium RIFCSPHIGHO2_12_FULL_53_13 TaxID=1798502 RepID=A0A1F6EC89_9BACT|nr:MAG: hypothetical protein A3F27_02775 [Candidatus Kaiserbacteria bacterium RIFCSPHIGHO2_12_FULL_53_13]OGG74755.1 MAG: hypothetical protein A3A37_00110 [Candidatus Kaiserbacteria bacterium RIFCSPLOWO2_01_FULL_52_36]